VVLHVAGSAVSSSLESVAEKTAGFVPGAAPGTLSIESCSEVSRTSRS
jgi:hypothetical protein